MSGPEPPDQLAFAGDEPEPGVGERGVDLQDLFQDAAIDRSRDVFVLDLLRELTGVLEEAVGLEEAQGFIGLVGGRIAIRMNEDYRQVTGGAVLDREQVAAALVDLKRRIEGGFSIERIDDEGIVLVNDACPFGPVVRDRQSLCMMTSNVFGRLAADNLGYARVELVDTIARGDGRCRVVVAFEPGGAGREYFG